MVIMGLVMRKPIFAGISPPFWSQVPVEFGEKGIQTGKFDAVQKNLTANF